MVEPERARALREMKRYLVLMMCNLKVFAATSLETTLLDTSL